MNNDNNENNIQQNQGALAEGFSALTAHFMPDGALAKGLEQLAAMKDHVLQLDSALSQLAKTSGLSAAELKNITEEAFRMGDAAGESGAQALSCIASAHRAGYDIRQSMALAEEALKMSSLSFGMDDAADAVSRLNTILDSFGKNANFASSINDGLAAVAGSGPADFDTLAQGMAALSESAACAGLSFEETLGLLSGAYAVLKDMDQVAGGEPAIFSMLKESYGSAGDVYGILDELSGVWNTLDAPARETFAISNAGDAQKEVFAALMDNWAGVESAVSSAQDSFGAADQASALCLDSLSAKTAVFQNKVAQLSAALMDSGILRFFLDLGSSGASALNSLSEKISALGSLGALAGGAFAFKNLGRANHSVVPL